MITLLEEKRNYKQLSLSRLALNIGVTKGYLSRIEKHPETCNPTFDLMFKLEQELDIDSGKVYLYFVESRIKNKT